MQPVHEIHLQVLALSGNILASLDVTPCTTGSQIQAAAQSTLEPSKRIQCLVLPGSTGRLLLSSDTLGDVGLGSGGILYATIAPGLKPGDYRGSCLVAAHVTAHFQLLVAEDLSFALTWQCETQGRAAGRYEDGRFLFESAVHGNMQMPEMSLWLDDTSSAVKLRARLRVGGQDIEVWCITLSPSAS
mmetsp:Transcript_112363/g.312666  ORF Transcript_112363/g.312666 Transcript_112363/m.312666 type:complete len:187 (-) Transcript_112363:53-613(-)